MASAGTPGKIVRFTQVVKRCGRPRVHILWAAPEKDPELKRARESQRMMMVTPRTPGAKAEVGSIGFDPAAARGAQLLIFPKSLRAFTGAQIIGIKFDLVDQPALAAATEDDSRPVRKKRPAAPKPAARHGVRESADEKPSAEPSKPNRAVNHKQPKPDRGSFRSARQARTPARDGATSSRARASHAHERSKPAIPKPAPTEVKMEESGAADSELLREVRAALKELHGGKAVAAYQRLERAVAAASAARDES